MPSKLCILENRPKWLLTTTFGGLQRVGLLRGREKMIYWCMPLFLSCFLSSFYHLLSVLFTLSFLLLSCRGLFPLRCFPISSMATSSFYSELIHCDFSFLPWRLHQLFSVCCGHPFRTTHQPIGCPTTTTAQYMCATPLLVVKF